MIDRLSLPAFDEKQIECLSRAVIAAEELVSDYYKLSGSEWRLMRYDFKTLRDLLPSEVVHGPLAQILRFTARPGDGFLDADSYDFYKVCIQDHGIIGITGQMPHLDLFAFLLYIASHELVHIVRFSRFFHGFEASLPQKLAEEKKVHETTMAILSKIGAEGMSDILRFYDLWQFRI